MFVYQKGKLPLASDLYKLPHCLVLKHNPQVKTIKIGSPQRKYEVVTLDHPGSSGGERAYPQFQGLWA